jgi:hypothetical protein
MATFAQIKEVRLQIADPSGFIDLLEASVFPGSPAPQTAYRIGGVYYETATEYVELQVSDDRISTWYDDYGTTGAVLRGLRAIVAQLGAKLPIVKSDSGAESTEYTSLIDIYAFYRGRLAEAEKEDKKASSNTTGRYYASATIEVAGGNI